MCAALITGVAAAKAQAPPGAIAVEVTVRTPNAVHVEARFMVGGLATPVELRILTRPCLVIENMRVTRDDVVRAGVETRRGPWLTWRDTTVAPGDSQRLTVGYDVWLGGSRTIPLPLLSGPASSGQDGATVTVRFAPRAALAAQVEFPRMTRSAPADSVGSDSGSRNGTRQATAEWSGSYVALPSFVRVGGPAFACDRLPPPGDNGGLVWRFALLVGIMVAWVPLYLAWARRSGDTA